MLDVKVLRDAPDSLREMLSARGADTTVVDQAIDYDVKKRECIT